jgi:sulfur carrier protein|tara:strand:- start:87 stop:290 length:204 start_codon:yes stop_codon:yes gene_type:complete
MFKLNINGLLYEYQPPMSTFDLLTYLGFNTDLILVDYNGTLLPKEQWEVLSLKEGDSLEILTLAGGG